LASQLGHPTLHGSQVLCPLLTLRRDGTALSGADLNILLIYDGHFGAGDQLRYPIGIRWDGNGGKIGGLPVQPFDFRCQSYCGSRSPVDVRQ
jgi:hypothetical protein